MAIRLDPLRACRWRRRHWQIADRDPLALLAAHTNGDNLLLPRQLNTRDLDVNTQNDCGEGDFQMILDHRVEAANRLRFVVAVHGRFLDKRGKLLFA